MGSIMRRGITIIELVMVMIIIGIVAAMSVPRIGMTGYKSDASARAVRGALQVAQRNAITRQSNVVVSFDLANGRLRILEDNNDNGAVDTDERVIHVPLEEGTRFAAPTMGRVDGSTATDPIAGSALKTIAGLTSIVLRRDGSSSSDVEIYLTVRTTVSNEFRAVVVTPSTGKADLYRYSGTAWIRLSQ
jgi:prepilin-type N-terminal cleavage/methylation domain-containing protein